MIEMTKQIESHLTANTNMSIKDVIVGNFLGGLAWGIGTVVGATLVVAAIGALLNSLGLFNGIKIFLEQFGNTSQQLPQLHTLYR